MNYKEEIIKTAQKKGIIRPRDIEKLGIPREYLLRLFKKGELERIGRGLYSLPGRPVSEHMSLAEVSAKYPHTVVCLLSALSFHGVTTQLPFEVWLAIERGKWKPIQDYPPLRIISVSGRAFSYGVEAHAIQGVSVNIYSTAKTIADCFKFRNNIGIDVAVEALKQAWSEKRCTMDELWEAAKACRVSNIIRPYMEAIV